MYVPSHTRSTIFFSLLLLFSQKTFPVAPNPIGTVGCLSQEEHQKTEPEDFMNLGNHIIAELTGCSNLNNTQELESVLRKAAAAAGATVLSVTVHQFEPFGMTGVAVLQESHISVHTWPEYGYASIDIYTCGEHVHLEEALKVLREFFLPKNVQVVSIGRGFEKTEDLL